LKSLVPVIIAHFIVQQILQLTQEKGENNLNQ
jgi:hypothetical protein